MSPSSLAVLIPEIAEVLDLRTGEMVSSHVAIGSDYGEVMALRMALRQAIAEGTPLYACPLCGVPVHLVARKEARRFFFRHLIEDGRCPARTKGMLSEAEINARKYDGVKESRDHIRMKEALAESLRCDPRFSGVKVEAVMKSQNRTGWRKPDVQALYNGIPVAFEIQLSTTFLRTIAERRVFYQREGGLLVWIFKTYDAERARLMQDDIFYCNNRNVFLVSDATLEASREAGKLILDCRWTEPCYEDGRLGSRWGGRLVDFGDLIIDRERQRVFLFDYDQAALALRVGDGQALRQEFERFWLSRHNHDSWDPDDWGLLRKKFGVRGIELPIEPNWGGAPSHLLNALYSAREGRSVGWRLRKLVDVAHRIADGHKKLLPAFCHALVVYERMKQIRLEDPEGTWGRKVESFRSHREADTPEYGAETRFDALVDFLFPELGRGAVPHPATLG